MTAARKPSRRRAKPPAESSIYDGARLCGTLSPKAGAFVARLASGKSLGQFANERIAQRAITAAARGEPASQTAPRTALATSRRPGAARATSPTIQEKKSHDET